MTGTLSYDKFTLAMQMGSAQTLGEAVESVAGAFEGRDLAYRCCCLVNQAAPDPVALAAGSQPAGLIDYLGFIIKEQGIIREFRTIELGGSGKEDKTALIPIIIDDQREALLIFEALGTQVALDNDLLLFLKNEAGKLLGRFVEDIRSQESLVGRELFARFPSPVYIFDRSGSKLLLSAFNDAAMREFQLDYTAFLGREITSFAPFSNFDDLNRILINKVLFLGEIHKTEFSLKADIEKTYCLRSFGSRSDAIYVQLEDITSQKKNDDLHRQGEEMYRMLVDNAYDAIYLLRGYHFEYVNPKFCEITGYSYSELTSPDFDYRTLIAENYRNIVVDRWEARMEAKPIPPEFRIEILTKSGQKALVEINTIVVPGLDEVSVLGIMKDHTETANTKAELQKVQVLLNAAIDQSPLGMIIADAPQVKVYIANKTALRILNQNIEASSRISKDYKFTDWAIHTPDGELLPFLEHPLTKAIRNGKTSENVELIVRSPGREDCWITASAAPVYDSAGNIIAGIVIFQDITNSKKVEAALIEAEERVSTFLDSVDDMIYFQNLDGKRTMLNQAYSKITGYLTEEFENDPDFWNRIIYEDDIPIIKDALKRKLNGLPDSGITYRLITKDGDIKWMQSKMVRAKDSSGNFSGYNCIDRDITVYKKAQEEILKLNRELETRVADRTRQLEKILEDLKNEIAFRKKTEEDLKLAKDEISRSYEQEKQLSELKTRFISMISHEYRTPLTVILTSSYLMEQLYQGTQKEMFLRQLEKVKLSVKGMTKLLEDVLTIGRADSGKLEYHPQTLDLIQICQDVIEEVRVADKNKHTVELNAEHEFIFLQTDEKLLKQVLANLIGNAVKYSLPGEKVIVELSEHEDKVAVSIIDTGIGIREEDKAFLFEPFHRGKNVGTISGTGLGLSIVKKCLETINGSLSIHSEVNRGSNFTVLLHKKAEI